MATLIAWGSLAAISWFDAALSVWILPVAIPLFLSIPLSVFSGSVSLGRLAYLFRIPEEESPPSLLEELRTVLMDEQRRLQSAVDRLHFRVGDAFMRAPQKSHPIPKSVAHSP